MQRLYLVPVPPHLAPESWTIQRVEPRSSATSTRARSGASSSALICRANCRASLRAAARLGSSVPSRSFLSTPPSHNARSTSSWHAPPYRQLPLHLPFEAARRARGTKADEAVTCLRVLGSLGFVSKPTFIHRNHLWHRCRRVVLAQAGRIW